MTASKSIGPQQDAIISQLLEITRISALAELASGIAHELNQPLGAIATYAQAGQRMLNRTEPLIGETAEVLRQINQQALGAGEDIRRIRKIFDQGEKRTQCQMSDIVRELEPLLGMLTRRIRGRLQIDADEGLPAVNVDRLRIQHVLFALVQNACDACADGSANPAIGVALSGDRYGVETSVWDSGPGVAPSMQDQLFRPFCTTKPHGTGLGLASSRAIVEAHEGTIGFENLARGGSRFWFRLPLAEHNRSGDG